MFTHDFTCPNCGKEITYRLYSISAAANCEHCKKQYIVSKNKFFLLIEIAVLLAILVLIRNMVASIGLNQYILEIILVAFTLWFGNVACDVLFTKWIKWKKYFTLMERMIQK